jgi:CheY-like chemotaxis protein
MTPKIILIVDDNKHDRLFFKNALKEIDAYIECIEAQDGKNALALLRHAQWLPNYIFLDSRMPLMSGTECLREIKRDERLKHIPVIMYSSTLDAEQTADNMMAGAAYSMSKTVDVSQFSEIIRKALEFVDAK